MEELVAAIISYGWLQWLAFAFSVLYVIFAAKEKIICWLFGLIGVSLLFFIYVQARLYSDALLQLFYIVMSIYGWITWSDVSKKALKISTLSSKSHVWLIAIGVLGTLILGLFFSGLGAAVPYIDAFTSSFAVIATYLVAQKKLENWIYWIIIDAICVFVYYIRDLPLISLLFALYTILAFVGLKSWKGRYQRQNLTV